MIIENPDAFYGWLLSRLDPLCDADPAALAKYVLALVKKDKPVSELRDFCQEQLEVFLSDETTAFIEILFETLNTKGYLSFVKEEAVNGEEKRPEIIVDSLDLNSGKIPTLEKDDKAKPRIIDLDSDDEISQSKKDSPRKNTNSYESHKEVKDKNRHYDFTHNEHSFRDHDRAIRKERRKNKNDDFNQQKRDRSRSPLRSRSGSNFFSEDRKSSSPCSSSSSSAYKPKSRSRNSEYNIPSSDSKDVPKKVSSPDVICEHGDTDYRLPSRVVPVENMPIPPAFEKNRQKSVVKKVTKRCKDYDEKGYCMQGAQCVYDHGSDPLEVRDIFTVPTRTVD